ncbi:F-type ATPase subunit delta [Bacteroidales bacterium Barb6XT]|nr:F-type ATPase subunit delta [Bacteroidales bacterium Barb6XT]
MNTGIISVRYSKAIYQYASAQGEETLLYGEMKRLSEQFRLLPLLDKVLKDPTVSAETKMEVVTTAANDKASNSFQRAFQLVLRNGRGGYIQHIALMYDKVYRKEKNILTAKLTTIQPADETIQRDLVRLIPKEAEEQIEFKAATDPDIIGGFVLEIEDMRLDASVKNQLNQLRLSIAKH